MKYTYIHTHICNAEEAIILLINLLINSDNTDADLYHFVYKNIFGWFVKNRKFVGQN